MAIMILWGADKDEKLKESERVLALKALYEVVETEFINEQVTVGLQEIEERLEKELNALQPGE